MRRRSVSCSRWARAGLDRREGLNLSHRFSCAVSELWVAGYFGGPGGRWEFSAVLGKSGTVPVLC